ncbi:MAG: GFA family protein [Gammaproteobacteria bacterium]|nr:GFA family protein [Gammaproteobacteria bacterium]
MPDRHGNCLCGAVRITAKDAGNTVGACHCRMCRRWGGGPFMEIDCGTEVTFAGDENVRVFASSDWAERGFCKQCGTHLFYRLKATGNYSVPIGLLEDDEQLEFRHQVFVDERPSYYEFSNNTRDMTGAELIAKFNQS